MIDPEVVVAHLTQMRTKSSSFRVHRCIIRENYCTLLHISFNQRSQVGCFSVQNVVKNCYLALAADHAENPLKLITMSLSFIYFGSKLSLIDLCSIYKLEVWPYSSLVIICKNCINQSNNAFKWTFHLSSLISVLKVCWTYMSPLQQSDNLV